MSVPGRDAGGAPGPRLRAALTVIGVGVVIAIVGGVGTGVTFANVISEPSYATPVTVHRHLSRATYEVYELTGTRLGGGGVTFNTNHSVTLTPNDVTVMGADGQRIPVRQPGNISETISRGRVVYTAAVRFQITHAGSYAVEVRATSTRVIVARSFGGVLKSVIGWVATLVIGVGATVVGIVLLIVGVVRRGQERPPAYAVLGALPAPGWYADPSSPGTHRWWDGARWTEHRSGPNP